jgi:hypothetical protein
MKRQRIAAMQQQRIAAMERQRIAATERQRIAAMERQRIAAMERTGDSLMMTGADNRGTGDHKLEHKGWEEMQEENKLDWNWPRPSALDAAAVWFQI